MTQDHGSDNDARTTDPDNPQHLLILAYTRLILLPERVDGMKFTTIASCGSFEVRLAEYSVRRPVPPLWVELYDRDEGRVVARVGCHDLQDAGAATESLIAEAARRVAQ